MTALDGFIPEAFDFFVGDLAAAHVESFGEAGIFGRGTVPSFVGDGAGIGGGGVA